MEAEAEAAMLLRRWGVEPAGPAFRTATSTLVPGLRAGAPVMLKVAHVEEERRGAALLAWWAGSGAVLVLERDGDALLLERATGRRDLTRLSAIGRDAEATDVLVDAALALHAHGVPSPGDGIELVPLHRWFRTLLQTTSTDPLLRHAAALAERLLRQTLEPDVVALHGDLHQGNVLDLGDRWAVIDPKGLLGHRAFDFGNLFCNPSEEVAEHAVLDRLARISARARLDPAELAAWTVAWCGLSLAWQEEDGDDGWHARATRAVAERLLPLVG